jgi:thiol-disulfide isomerase/thioredoxin
MRSLAVAFLIGSVILAADPPTDLNDKKNRQPGKNKEVLPFPDEFKGNPSDAKLPEGEQKTRRLTNSRLYLLFRKQFSQMVLGRDPKPGSQLEPDRVGPAILKPGEAGVGRQVPDVSFTDVAGRSGRLSDLKDKKAVVIAFTSTSCAISKKYAPALARLEKSYFDKGVAFVFVNSVATDSLDDLKAFGLIGPYIHDKDGEFAAKIGAEVTTDAFLIDPARTVIYRGAVDDQYGPGYAHDQPKRVYLASAIDALLAGKQPVIAATEAPGSSLDAKKSDATPPTYHRDISRLAQAHCVECHRKDGAAPFSLETYKDVIAHAGEIRRVVDKGIMPPWFAAQPKDRETPWVNDPSLTKHEKEQFLAWLKSDRPEGDKADAPIARTFDPGWQIGKPDLIVKPKEPIKVKAEGTMPYQNVVVETKLDEDKWVQALEVRPSAKQVVHHILVFVRGRVAANPLEGIAGNDSISYYAIYVPGNSSVIYPDGFGKKLPKGAKVHFQIHYTPNGTATEDVTELGIVYAKEKPKQEVRVMPLFTPTLMIPPGADNHEVSATEKLPFNAKIIGFLPHMHLRGKAFRYEVIDSDGKKEVLLDIPRYDFNWQLLYKYAEPRGIPRGSTLKATGWFDNSAKNPANPDPTKTVRWGLQTYEEMMLGYVEYYIP